MNMANKLLTLIKDLVKFPTTNDNLNAINGCFDYIGKKLSFYPFIVKEFEKNGVKSVVWSTKNTLKPDLILNAHIDVVPANKEMFLLKTNGNKLVGRGVSDMKFAIAMFITTLERIYNIHRKLPNLGLLITSDEEKGGFNGTNYLINKIGFRSKAVIIPDGGDNFKIVEKAKGVYQLKIRSFGKSAHGSRPWEGENAIEKIIKASNQLRKLFPIPEINGNLWKTTVNISKINGGDTINQVCDSAELYLDIRFTEKYSRNSLLSEIEKIFPTMTIEEIVYAPDFSINRKNKYIKEWEELLQKNGFIDIYVKEHGASDGRFFSAAGIPTIVCKPVGGNIHSEDEWINLDSVVSFTNILQAYIEEFTN
jgi:succinyl-diaminopimelate desuccinylase